MDNNKNELVVKSNRLVEASYRLTLAEQRIILLAIVEARRTGKGLNADDFVAIRATDYAAMFDLALNQAYEQIKEATKTLFRRYVVLYDTDPDSGKPRMIEVRWLSAAAYIDGAGTIQIRFATDMVPYITHLEAEFTRYKLEKVANMSSAYAIRLYELLIQWGSVGYREIELASFRKMLMVEYEYKSIKDLKKWVIDVALTQINEHSDLTASYTQRKTGRVVTHLIFTFGPKENPKPKKPAAKPKPEPPEMAFDKAKATPDELVAEFLAHHDAYQRDYANIAPCVARRTPAIWRQFADKFERWARGA
jgi:plasmid replication initiation protein